jgi:hypothetical protein
MSKEYKVDKDCWEKRKKTIEQGNMAPCIERPSLKRKHKIWSIK